MTETNGNVKWHQLVIASITILGIIVTIAIFSANQAIAIDVRSNERDAKLEEKLYSSTIATK